MADFKSLVLQMLDKMDDEFKKQNETTILCYFEKYPVLFLMKDDLREVVYQNYEDNPQKLSFLLNHIDKLDAEDMQNVADDLVNECMMDSFWIGVDNYFDELENG